MKEYFRKLRFDKNHHLGLGDVRLTIGMQEELIAKNAELLDALKKIYLCPDAGIVNFIESKDMAQWICDTVDLAGDTIRSYEESE